MQLNTLGVKVPEQKPRLLICHGRVLYLPRDLCLWVIPTNLFLDRGPASSFMWLGKCCWEDGLFLLKNKEELLCFAQNFLLICFHCGAIVGRSGQNERGK